MQRRLAIHHLCATDIGTDELAEIAAKLDVPDISVFVRAPGKALDMFPTIRNAAEAKTLRARLDGLGVSVHNVEAFPIGSKTDIAAFEADLEKSAILRARRATTHVHDPNIEAALEKFAALCALARRFGILISLEFMNFSAIKGFKQAVQFVSNSGVEDATIVVDALHLHRTGGSPALINANNAHYIGSLQLCDGLRETPADPFREAIHSRLLPGDGELPLPELLAAVPRDVQIDLEVPQGDLRLAGVSALERIRRVVDRARPFLET